LIGDGELQEGMIWEACMSALQIQVWEILPAPILDWECLQQFGWGGLAVNAQADGDAVILGRGSICRAYL